MFIHTFKKKIMRLFCLVLLFTSLGAQAQVFSNKEVSKKRQGVADSLKAAPYPYDLPIWGAKAQQKGYNLPYSAGLSVQYFQQTSAILINNLQVGFNNQELYNLDGLVRFNNSEARATAFTFRPDIWIFPFLNVYGILGSASASTDVNFGLWLPDSNGVSQNVFNTGTNISFQTVTAGFGITPTIGVAGGFLALDMNFTWTEVPQLEDPAFTFVFGPRFGKNFNFGRPEQSAAVWVGGFRASIRSNTSGSIPVSDIAPSDGNLQDRVDEGKVAVETYSQQVEAWWNGLSPAQQANPINQAKYNRSTALLGRAANVLDAFESALNAAGSSTVQYQMDKKLQDAWNFIVGGQYQYNKHWMIRAEFGFLGSRTQGLVGLQYRFGL